MPAPSRSCTLTAGAATTAARTPTRSSTATYSPTASPCGAGSCAMPIRGAARSSLDGLYVWVLEQNRDAQAFYEACGAERVGREPVTAPGGVAGRLTGAPAKLRYAWDQPEGLVISKTGVV